ncbi:MCE family protein [Nocardioides ferulae]|uniref:MCE family protein n=1 Tax=Nocardioides ferulae TaxID=2340821 RepID=UPI000EB3DDBE|nr:MlaD family protein [Nocardioides ferulae]
MADRSEAQIRRLGVVALVVLLVVMAAAFNLQQFPGFRGTGYHAELSDASGLRKGHMVQIAGNRVGRVGGLRVEDGRVVVDFELDPGVELGPETTASVEVLNLLGEKYLELVPEGEGDLEEGGTIPLERTESAYDIVNVLGDLTETTESIDDRQLGQALEVIASTLEGSESEIQASFTGLSRLSRSVASRDDELEQLLTRADSVTGLLADRRGDLVRLMQSSSAVFDELDRRRAAIHRLLVNARRLAVELEGLADDNERDLGPALRELRQVTTLLKDRKDQVRKTAAAVGPYAEILGHTVGTGPWFDAYLVNLFGLAGEFLPGQRDD